MIVDETDVWGVWTDPVEAVKWFFKEELELNHGIIHDNSDNECTADEMAAKMLDPHSDYPAIEEIEINPTSEPWTIDR
jgi:hypothetical protein